MENRSRNVTQKIVTLMRKRLTRLAGLGLVVCLGACGETQLDQADEVQADLVINNVTTIDAVSGARASMNVVVQGSVITEVSESSTASVNATTVVDGSGKYLIPGLWDAHVHTTFTPELSDSMFALFIANGITSIRDTGGQLDLVSAWKQKSIEVGGPTTYIAGPLIDGVPTVYSGEQPGFPKIAMTAATPAEVEQAVDELVEAGVDLLKAYEMLTPEAFKALIKRAHHHGLPVTGHVPLSMTAADVAATGLNSMEHLRNLEMDCSSREPELYSERQDLLSEGSAKPGSKLRSEIHGAQHAAAARTYDPERCGALIKLLADNDVWQVPTLALTLFARAPYFIEPEWASTFDYLPSDIQQRWRSGVQSFKSRFESPSVGMQEQAEVADWRLRMIKDLVAANVPIMAGTDTPIFYATPGYSLHKELQVLVGAGLTPMLALEAATLAPAKYFGLESIQGLIAPGMLADLVLLDADPLQDIKNTRQINSVIRSGTLLDRGALDKLLVSARQQTQQ